MRIHIKNTDFSKLSADGVCHVTKEMIYNTFLLLTSGDAFYSDIEVCEEETRQPINCVILNAELEEYPDDNELSQKVLCHMDLESKDSFSFRNVLSIKHADFKQFKKVGYGEAFVEMTYKRFVTLTKNFEESEIIIKDEETGFEIRSIVTLADHEEGFRDDIEEDEVISPYFEFESKSYYKERKDKENKKR